MRAASLLLCAAALAPWAAPADAATAGARELATAFRTICLDHLGDPLAQTTAALAAPFYFTADGPPEDDEARFSAALGTLGINEPTGSCALSGEVDLRLDLAAFQAAMGGSLPLGPASPMESPDSVYWLISAAGGEGQFVIALTVSSGTGRNIVTLLVQKRLSPDR